MSKIKSLILGSAASIAVVAGAQAADLPVKAKAVQYVKICSLYGAGFYYIPGTDTCIKLGGYIQLDVNIRSNNYNNPALLSAASGSGFVTGGGVIAGVSGTLSRDSDNYTTRSRAQFNVDTRTATEYGVVRTYWGSNFEHSSGWGPSSGNLTMDLGFIQFAGFTFGKAVSTFVTPWSAYTANINTSAFVSGADDATGITMAAYTFQFGNGVSAQLSLEDNKTIMRAPVLNAGAALTAAYLFNGSTGAGSIATAGANGAMFGTGGNLSPDIVGNILVDQSAFSFQLSAAAHNVNPSYYAATNYASTVTNELAGHPNDKWGWAISGGLLLKNLPTGAGDKFAIDVTYTEGAPKYIISGTVGNSFYRFSGSGAGAYQSFAAAALFDGVYGTQGSSLELTKVWGVRAGYLHNWSPTLETGVFGGYTHVDYGSGATAAIQSSLANSGLAFTKSGGWGTYNPDFNIWQVGARTAWTPVRNLTFSGEVLYTYLDQANSGTLSSTSSANATGYKPAGVYEYKDQGAWSGNLRVRRTF
jgi:hypothetical protein